MEQKLQQKQWNMSYKIVKSTETIRILEINSAFYNCDEKINNSVYKLILSISLSGEIQTIKNKRNSFFWKF